MGGVWCFGRGGRAEGRQRVCEVLVASGVGDLWMAPCGWDWGGSRTWLEHACCGGLVDVLGHSVVEVVLLLADGVECVRQQIFQVACLVIVGA